jgi:predicted nucleotidyltransferase
MSQPIYGIRYLLNRVIPLKRLGKVISRNIILTYPQHLPEITLCTLSRITLIETIAHCFETNDESIEKLREKVLIEFNNFKLDTTDVRQHFDNYIERRKKVEHNFNLLKEKREKMFMKK